MKLAYYPGCSASGSGIEFDKSTRALAAPLGYELTDIPDWNCCGATSGHSTNQLLSMALPARTLAIAEDNGMETILAPCAACYSRHRHVEHVIQHDEAMKAKIEAAIDHPLQGKTQTISALELLARDIGLDHIKEKVKEPLRAVKAAAYYGCLLVRPPEHCGFDDPEHPESMDDILAAIGANPVDWNGKVECCGAALVTARPEVGGDMLYRVLKSAKDAGAECIITACPLCMMNLDMRQAAIEKRFGISFNLPIYYITEMVAVALGILGHTIGLDQHFVEAEEYVSRMLKQSREVLAEEIAQAEEQARLEAEKAAAKAAKVAEAKAKAEAAKANKENATAEGNASTAEDPDAKKIEDMLKAIDQAPEKELEKLMDSEANLTVLLEVIANDQKKKEKLAELLVKDHDKAAKTAQAIVSGELKKRAKG